jgi:hypothetical protein
MPKLFFSLIAVVLTIITSGQSKKAIELSLLTRYDQHANYVSNFAGRAHNDTYKLYGTSYGINALYRQYITKSYSVYVGAGYYRLAIDKIRGPLPLGIPGTRTARNIDYDDGITKLLYSTSEYYYNDIAFTVGMSKTLMINDRLHFDLAAEGVGLQTFSQRYGLFDGSRKYTTQNTKPLELGINVTAGFVKEFNKFYVRPALLIPVYQNLKGDKVFYESKDMNISKWFHGVGLTFKVGKYI